MTRLSRRQALAGGGVTALAAAAAAAPEATAQACRPEPTTITVEAGRVLGPLPKFWRCTGFTPAELLLLPEMRQTLSFLGAVPNRGLEFVRVHYLLDLDHRQTHRRADRVRLGASRRGAGHHR